jgi:surface protein
MIGLLLTNVLPASPLTSESGTVQAEQYTVTYDANGGTFDDGSTTNAVTYDVVTAYQQFAHTDNIDDSGVATGTYAKNLSQTKAITFSGASSLHIDVWYSAESTNYDWLAIYSGASIIPSDTNYASSVSGKLGGGQQLTKENASTASYDLTDTDTVQFYFKSDSSGNYYGYYAIITAKNASGAVPVAVVSIADGSTYKTPSKAGSAFVGWTTDVGGTEQYSTTRAGIPTAVPSSNSTVYAKWNDTWYTDYSYTLDATNSTITLNTYNGNDTDLDVPGTAVIEGTTYAVKLKSTSGNALNGIWHSKRAQIASIKIESGVSAPQDASYMFYDLAALNSLDISGLNTSTVTNMGCMFDYCSNLVSLNIGSQFNTSAVTDMNYMFYNCSSLVSMNLGDLFSTSSVTNMNSMFGYCSGLTSLDLGSQFNTSAVVNMSAMFDKCSRLVSLNLGNQFNTSAVTNMNSMFSDCSGLVSLNLGNQFSTAAVTSMSYMFSRCSGLASLNLGSQFNTSATTTMYCMFLDCSKLVSLNLGDKFNTSAVTNMSYMFCNCSCLTSLDLGNQFNTSSVTNMEDMFDGCFLLSSLNLGDKFNTSVVTNMGYMFSSCLKLAPLDLGSQFNTSAVTNMESMFYGCSSLTSLNLGDQFNTSAALNMKKMFMNCSGLTSLNLGNQFNTSAATNMSNMFSGCSSLISLDLGSLFDTLSVTDMNCMFYDCSSLTSLILGDRFNTSIVTNTRSMFHGCSSLTSLNLGDEFNMASVTNSNEMFFDCSSLSVLNLGNKFDTSAVTNMYGMFQGCSGLVTMDLGDKFNTSAVTNMNFMFYKCSKLASIDFGNHFNTSAVTGVDDMFDSCSSLSTLDLSGFDLTNASSITSMIENTMLSVFKTPISASSKQFRLSGFGSKLYDLDNGNKLYMQSSYFNLLNTSHTLAVSPWVDVTSLVANPASAFLTFANIKQSDPALYITKSLSGSSSETASFEFTVSLGSVPARNAVYELYDEAGEQLYQYGSTITTEKQSGIMTQFTTDDNGILALKAGQTAKFTDVEAGETYRVHEIASTNYEQILPAGGDATGIISTEGSVAAFTNQYQRKLSPEGDQTTSIRVSKAIAMPSGYASPVNPDFTFTISVDGTVYGNQSYTVKNIADNSAVSTGQTTSAGGFTLKGGQYAVFDGIAANTDYSITEASTEGWRTVSSQTVNGSTTDVTNYVSFTNVMASFGVTKTLINSTDSVPFTFTLKNASGAAWAGASYYVYDSSKVLKSTASSVTDANGQFTINSGETALFTGIDAGTEYSVSEVPNASYIQRVPAGADGYVNQTVDNAVEILPFENEAVDKTLSGNLHIHSSQTIPDAISNAEYSFLLEKQTGADTYEAVPSASYIISTGETDSTYTTDAAGRFKLRADETVRFHELDASSTYRVTQVAAGLASGLSITSTNPQTGTSAANSVLPFVDEYSTKYSVHLTKMNTDKAVLPNAVFMLYDNIAQLIPVATATSDSNGLLTFSDLDCGTTYYIKETSAPDGYDRLTHSIPFKVISANNSIQVTFDGSAIISTNTADDVYLSADTENHLQINAAVTDASSAGMPATGGSGVFPYYMFGLLISVGASLYLLSEKRRRLSE